MDTKNLFDYATKELSQDAYLRWLFESWENGDIKPYVVALLIEFGALEADEKIKEIKTIAQEDKIDVIVKVSTDKRKTAVFIEDKTFTDQHDSQLARYNGTVKKWEKNGWNTRRIYYKTSLLSAEDKTETAEQGWEAFDIERIYRIYSPMGTAKNEIVKQYVKSLKRMYIVYKNEQMPRSNSTKIDYICWRYYFENRIIPQMELKFGDEIEWHAMIAGQSQVTCLRGYKKGTFNGVVADAPLIEVQSAICTHNKKTGRFENNFRALITCYDIPKELLEKRQKDIDAIKAEISKGETLFSTSYPKYKDGRVQRQIGQSKKAVLVKTDAEFIDILTKHTEDYLKLLSRW